MLRQIYSIIFALLATWTIAGSASAYCINPDFKLLWQDFSTATPIPVSISIGPETSVTYAGLTSAEAERLVREIIARHNEASIGPALVYVGYTNHDMDYNPDIADEDDDGVETNAKFGARPDGITIDSYSCAWKTEFQPCGDDPKTRACAQTAHDKPKARVTLVPIGCGDGKTPHNLTDHDAATVLLHELGHALGLRHNQVNQATCEDQADQIHGNHPEGNDGVMRGIVGANFPATREWRRDDLDGLAAIYGPSPAMELAYWDDAIFPESPAASELISLIDATFQRPPAATSASPGAVAEQFLATTDADARVIVYTFSPAGLSPPTIVDPSPAGRSWGNPGVALGDYDVLVAWSANELPEDDAINLRWATRPLADGDWTITQYPQASRVKRIAAGYVPSIDRFLITTLTAFESHPRLVIVDPQGPLEFIEDIPEVSAFDIGPPACFLDGPTPRCVIPYSTNSFAGPKLGWLDLEFDDLAVPWLLDHTAGHVEARGKLGLASRPDLQIFRGHAGARRYDLAQIEGLGAADLPTLPPPPELDAHAWPVACGSAHTHRDAPRWSTFARRRVECGDGLVQATEQCDDANLEPGDGCSAECTLEDQPAPDLDPGATGTDGGYGLDDEDDCECRARTSASPTPLIFMVLLLGARSARLARR